jgi:hypothetical protein
MKLLSLCILAAAFLIAGAILVGCSLLADSTMIFAGFACMLLGCLLPFAERIASYFRSFSANGDEKDRK